MWMKSFLSIFACGIIWSASHAICSPSFATGASPFFSISRTACHEVSEPHAWNLFVENWLKLKLHNFNSIQMFYIEMQSFQDHFKHAPRTHVTTLPMFNLMLIMLIYWKVRPGSPTSAGQIMKVANLDSKSVSQWDSFWATIHYL